MNEKTSRRRGDFLLKRLLVPEQGFPRGGERAQDPDRQTGAPSGGVDLGGRCIINRATAQTMSQNLINSVKDIQRTVEIFINHFVVTELLLESDFNFDPLDEENVVRLVFSEIDIDAKVKKENHYTDMFNKNMVTQDEARSEIGREPLEIPTGRETENDQYLDEKYKDWYRTFWKLIDEPKTLIQAVDEPASPVAQAAVTSASLDINKQNVAEGQKQQAAKAKLEANLKKGIEAAKGQRGTAVRVKNFQDGVVQETFSQLKTYMIDTVSKSNITSAGSPTGSSLIDKWFRDITNTAVNKVIASFQSKCMSQFVEGYDSERGATEAGNPSYLRSTRMGRNILKKRVDRYINRLRGDIERKVSKCFDDVGSLTKEDCIEHIRATFDSYLYRARFIEDVEERKAFNIGRLAALRDKGYATYEIENAENACDRCKHYSGRKTAISFSNVGDIPPFHSSCRCKIVNPEHTVKLTSADAEEEDGDKLERCVLSVKSDLRKRHPDWDEKKVKSAAFAICNSRIKGK